MTEPRSLRNLHQDIAYANTQVKRARQDGGCEQIVFWCKRLDELLDRLCAQQTQGTAPMSDIERAAAKAGEF